MEVTPCTATKASRMPASPKSLARMESLMDALALRDTTVYATHRPAPARRHRSCPQMHCRAVRGAGVPVARDRAAVTVVTRTGEPPAPCRPRRDGAAPGAPRAAAPCVGG